MVKSLLGGAIAILKLPKLSARIGVKWLLGGANYCHFEKQANLSARIRVKYGKVVVGRCWRHTKQLHLSARIGAARALAQTRGATTLSVVNPGLSLQTGRLWV